MTFNGQVVAGLNMNNITGMPPVSSRGPTPISESGITTTPRSNTPSLETLAGLLNQNCNVSGLANLQTNLGNLTSSGNISHSPGSVTPTFSSGKLTGLETLADFLFVFLHIKPILKRVYCKRKFAPF